MRAGEMLLTRRECRRCGFKTDNLEKTRCRRCGGYMYMVGQNYVPKIKGKVKR